MEKYRTPGERREIILRILLNSNSNNSVDQILEGVYKVQLNFVNTLLRFQNPCYEM